MSNSLRSICLLAALAGACFNSPAADAEVVRLQINPETVISRISPDFLGFGFETAAVAQSNFFSASNLTMIQLYRNLSPHGLIRVGGIISDHTRYVPDGMAAPRTQTEVTIINRKNLQDLAGFVRSVDWKVMWGLNLGTGSQEEAVREAMAVAAALGKNLQSFQIGNEVEALRRFGGSYDAYYAAYRDYKAAIRSLLPKAPFSGPDSIGNLTWITHFAAAEARDIQLLTQHYYRGGAADPRTSIERLLQHDDGWDKRLENLRRICQDNGLAFRINEVNSFSGGGKAGVSDTFASALWCLDYMFLLASYGCEGVNMETDVNQLGFISHYSPIVHDPEGRCTVKPEYYGMLAFAMAGKGEMLKVTLQKTPVNLSAYATRDEVGHFWVSVVNKDETRDATVEIASPAGDLSADVFRLSAPSIESTTGVTLAGAAVSANGNWTPGPPEHGTINNRTLRLPVPHASAVLLRVAGQSRP